MRRSPLVQQSSEARLVQQQVGIQCFQSEIESLSQHTRTPRVYEGGMQEPAMLQAPLNIIRVPRFAREHSVHRFLQPREGSAQEQEGNCHEAQVIGMGRQSYLHENVP